MTDICSSSFRIQWLLYNTLINLHYLLSLLQIQTNLKYSLHCILYRQYKIDLTSLYRFLNLKRRLCLRTYELYLNNI